MWLCCWQAVEKLQFFLTTAFGACTLGQLSVRKLGFRLARGAWGGTFGCRSGVCAPVRAAGGMAVPAQCSRAPHRSLQRALRDQQLGTDELLSFGNIFMVSALRLQGGVRQTHLQLLDCLAHGEQASSLRVWRVSNRAWMRTGWKPVPLIVAEVDLGNAGRPATRANPPIANSRPAGATGRVVRRAGNPSNQQTRSPRYAGAAIQNVPLDGENRRFLLTLEAELA